MKSDFLTIFGHAVWVQQTLKSALHTQDAKRQILSIFSEDSSDIFLTPKPSRLVELACKKHSIILDSFAGSGTTAHAVLEANKRDDGNRRFILVEGEDYADKLTAERVRRVINGYAFTGTQKIELLRESLNWRVLSNANALVDKVAAIENLHGHEYEKITKQVKDGELIVTGEKSVAERKEGLGGSFSCTWPGFERDYGGWLFWMSYCLVIFSLCVGIRIVWRKLFPPTT
jgi:adenine-specific DNA-methyltransferase